jgi:hypothetical protein
MGGKVNVYRRENSDNWQCSTCCIRQPTFGHRDSYMSDVVTIFKHALPNENGRIRDGVPESNRTV